MNAVTDPEVRLLAALADPVRMAIVRQLGTEGTVCACDLGSGTAVSQPTISHHLKVLREAGLLDCERRGTWVHYRVIPSALAQLSALLATEPGVIESSACTTTVDAASHLAGLQRRIP